MTQEGPFDEGHGLLDRSPRIAGLPSAQGFGRNRPFPEGRRRVVRRRSTGSVCSRSTCQRPGRGPPPAALLPSWGPYDTDLLEKASEEALQGWFRVLGPRGLLRSTTGNPPAARRDDRADQDARRTVREPPNSRNCWRTVVAEVERSGPGDRRSGPPPPSTRDRVPDKSNWGWNWLPVKSALEYLFWSGWITAGRGEPASSNDAMTCLGGCCPGTVHESRNARSREEATRDCWRSPPGGVGTARCPGDYFRPPARESEAGG